MKALHLAWKDLRLAARDPITLALGLGAPLMITAVVHLALGGAGETGIHVPTTRVQVASADRPAEGEPAVGKLLVDFLRSDALGELLETRTAGDAEARAAVAAGEADVALLLPEDLSSTLLSGEGRAVVRLRHDPTLTVGPGLVKEITSQVLDGLTGAQVARGVTERALLEGGRKGSPELMREAARRHVAWGQAFSAAHANGTHPALAVEDVSGGPAEGAGAGMLGGMLAGMMVFFAFFAGANGALSVVREDEAGTLSRLMATPTSPAAILGGKFIAVAGTVAVQTVLLLVGSRLLFGIPWGGAELILPVLGLVAAATGFGALLTSAIRSSKQGGPVVGGVLAVLGMAGGLFSAAMPEAPAFLELTRAWLPQGWALRGFELVLRDAPPAALVMPAAVASAMGAGCFVLGAVLLRRRFAGGSR